MSSTQGPEIPPTTPSASTAQPNTGAEHAKKPKENVKIKMLEEKIAELTKKLGGRDPDKLVKQHHERLHKYNEMKDTAQYLIAVYANMNNTTLRAIHEQYGLPLAEGK